MQQLPSRLERLLNFLETAPDDSFLRYALAKEYEKMGELDKALHEFNLLLEKEEDYVGAYYHLGKLLEQLNQAEKAYFTYKKGMEVARKVNDQHALSELAGAKLNLGDEDDFE